MSFVNVAYAMGTAGQQAQNGGNPIAAFAPLILMFGIFYFLLIRPQQKKAKEHKALLESLKPGDQVLTAGGMYGSIVSVEDTVLVVDLGETKVRVGREFISGVITPESKKDKKNKKKAEK